MAVSNVRMMSYINSDINTSNIKDWPGFKYVWIVQAYTLCGLHKGIN